MPDVQIMEKMNSNQCVKNCYKSFQCSMNKGIKMESENDVKGSILNISDSAVKSYNQPFSTDKKHQLTVPFDVSCRKSPIHGKAPRNSPFCDNKGFQKLNSMESSAGETLDTGLNFKSEITPTEPANISKFHKTSMVNDKCESSYPSDDKDCAKIISNQDNNFFLENKSTKERTRFTSRNNTSFQNTEYSDEFITKKSEDSRSLTQKRCSEVLLRSRVKPTKKPAAKTKGKKGKNCGVLNRSNVRLTRSQKKDAAPAPIVGAGDDDSGIQGDIYEFSEKESNLEDISLPNRVPHLRDKYHTEAKDKLATVSSWRSSDLNQESRYKEDLNNVEDKNNE